MNDIQILSDVHLEERQTYDFEQTAKYLALLGDIGYPERPEYKNFLFHQAERYEKVFLLAGNHEYYNKQRSETILLIERVVAEVNEETVTEKLIFLNQTRYDLDNEWTILGCTLWSDLDMKNVRYIYFNINDFQKIKNFSTYKYNEAHENDLAFLHSQLNKISTEEKHRKVIVLSHHAPLTDGTSSRKYKGSPLASVFGTDLFHLMNHPIKMWAFGHTHYRTKFDFNNICIISNAVGYINENVE